MGDRQVTHLYPAAASYHSHSIQVVGLRLKSWWPLSQALPTLISIKLFRLSLHRASDQPQIKLETGWRWRTRQAKADSREVRAVILAADRGALVSVMEEARRHTIEAIRVFVELDVRRESELVRLNAAEAILSQDGATCSGISGRWQFCEQKTE